MQKLYYTISEVSKFLDEETHILRYWEKEFTALKPKKNKAGNRIYSEKDIRKLFLIKELLRKNKLQMKDATEKLTHIIKNDPELDEMRKFFGGKSAIDQLFDPDAAAQHRLHKEEVRQIIGLLDETIEFIKKV